MAETTPADELRQAAANLRGPAARATPGPWGVELVHGNSHGIYSYSGHAFTATVGDLSADEHAPADAEWIALMSPVLAEPLAAWLESWDSFDIPESAPHSDDWEHALAIARAINGTSHG